MSISVTPRSTRVLLYQGDDRRRLRELLDDVSNAAVAEDSPVRIADTGTGHAVEAYNTFLAEAEGRAVAVELQALPRRKYRAMVTEHTTTKKGEDGEPVDTVDDFALADLLVPACMALAGTPRFDTDAERDTFLDALNDADFSRLYTGAVEVNTSQGVVDPKSLSVSDLTLSSDET